MYYIKDSYLIEKISWLSQLTYIDNIHDIEEVDAYNKVSLYPWSKMQLVQTKTKKNEIESKRNIRTSNPAFDNA